jgi:hypothetical protein
MQQHVSVYLTFKLQHMIVISRIRSFRIFPVCYNTHLVTKGLVQDVVRLLRRRRHAPPHVRRVDILQCRDVCTKPSRVIQTMLDRNNALCAERTASQSEAWHRDQLRRTIVSARALVIMTGGLAALAALYARRGHAGRPHKTVALTAQN